jgi:CheY-like chemotaxis protein
MTMNAFRAARILLVDDNANDVELTLDAFGEGQLGNHIDVARSGREALDLLFGRTVGPDGRRAPPPDLILLDLKMPGIDGFEVLRQVKAAPVLRRIPVVILTSSREEGDRAMSYDTGANSYLVKPVSFDGMLAVVKKIEDYWLTINVGPPLPGTDDDGEAPA